METRAANPQPNSRKADLPDPARVTAARVQLVAEGRTARGWARDHGEKVESVYKVLSGKRSCIGGDAHRIAIKLGIVDGSLDGGPAHA